MSNSIKLTRSCEVIGIPSGIREVLAEGTAVRITQSLGDSHTVAADNGYLYRVDAKDADALGLTAAPSSGIGDEFSEKAVWDQLKSVYDPEIPVNIVELGLVYACDIRALGADDYRIDIKMSLTAPGCGMANVLKADVERKLSGLPHVKEVSVEVVFDPPWSPARMSDAAKLQLGFDMDLYPSDSVMPIYRGS